MKTLHAINACNNITLFNTLRRTGGRISRRFRIIRAIHPDLAGGQPNTYLLKAGPRHSQPLLLQFCAMASGPAIQHSTKALVQSPLVLIDDHTTSKHLDHHHIAWL